MAYTSLTTSHVSERDALCDALEGEIVTLASRMAAAEYRFLTCVRELEDVVSLIDCSYAEWLGWRCGMATSTAFERIRVARALAELPVVSAAFAEGRLTYSKVRVVTRIANAETDAVYCEHALLCSVRQLESLVAAHRAVDATEARRHMDTRYLSITPDDDGMVTLRGKLAPEDAAILIKALDAARTAGAECSVDALVEVARAANEKLATGDDAILHVAITPVTASLAATPSPRRDDMHASSSSDSTRGDEVYASSASDSARGDEVNKPSSSQSPRGDNAHTHGHQHAAPCCSVEGLPIAWTTAERLLCEQPNRRGISAPQRRVLMQRQNGCCAYPKCTHRRFLDGHHLIAWSLGGPTVVENLVILCRKHHRLLHEGQHTVRRENGRLVFRNAGGAVIDSSGQLLRVERRDRDLATTVQPTRRIAGWDGERLDKDWALAAVLGPAKPWPVTG